jgi:DNA-binding CsgD family transcriptional regulator
VVRVVGRVGISESDLRRLLELVDPARHGESGEFVPDSFLRDLPAVLGCDWATFHVMDPYRWEGSVQELVEDPLDKIPEVDELGRAAFWEAFCYPQRSGDFVSVTRSTDRLPGVGRGPCFDAYLEARGDTPGLAALVPLPPVGQVDRRLLLCRGDGSDFTDRDIDLLTLLRPHVVAMHQGHQAARSGVPRLTSRQRAILQQVAVGRTNRQVAHALVISEGTVRKHLENIYERLEVNSRTEALAKAMH